MGTDNLGRSVWELVVNGARLSVAFGLVTMLIAVLIGLTLGGIAGFWGGRVDNLLMRVVDVLLAAVAVRHPRRGQFLGGGNWYIDPARVTSSARAGIARLVRSLFLTLRNQEFVEAARAAGVGDRRIVFRHILPNAVSPIIVGLPSLVAVRSWARRS